ncbi:transposase [Bradyrhizobium diazoefficiens]|uniref:transposase n=1 Tax=Bradyrhizobium diazoefficiens TaxID=1355477 RepID=UPI001FEE558F|nr:transposase [Bradyrhizobium diazoefficiens]
MDEEADAWFDCELAGCSLADERLNKRLAVCGILMHSSLAVTTEGLPLGLTAVKF